MAIGHASPLAGQQSSVIAFMDDASPNSAKITFKTDDNQDIEIDYLYQITGLSNDDIESYSLIMPIDESAIKVLYPLLCMESKISNLAAHPLKRSSEGVEQARLSIEIASAFISELIDDSPGDKTFGLIERIARFSQREPAKFAFYNYGIDTLSAIPIEKYPPGKFKSIRYPQIQAEINAKREKFKLLMEKREKLGDTSAARYRL